MAVSKLGIEKDLKDILDIRDQDESTPTAFISETANQPILVIAYEIDKGFMGTGGTSVTLRAYGASSGKFTLADSTGDNLDGYANISVKELRSTAQSLPKGAGDVWLLAWGYMTGANGPNVRMRLFAFDGDKFRTVWMPENSWGYFEIAITSNGFVVEGDYYKEARKRHDTYVLTEDGLYHGK